jgi:hypothetical protein
MSDIVWEDPPESTQGQHTKRPTYDWKALLGQLRDQPFRWANLGRHNSGYVSHIRQGRAGGVPPGDFDATIRDLDGRTGTLYVRYVGSGDAGAHDVTSGEVGQ